MKDGNSNWTGNQQALSVEGQENKTQSCDHAFSKCYGCNLTPEPFASGHGYLKNLQLLLLSYYWST